MGGCQLKIATIAAPGGNYKRDFAPAYFEGHVHTHPVPVHAGMWVAKQPDRL